MLAQSEIADDGLDQAEIVPNVVAILTNSIFASIGAILISKFGVGGIRAARDRFWPAVYDRISAQQAASLRPPGPSSLRRPGSAR
jgi:hypothetical protein